MDKKLLAHEKYVKSEIKKFEHELKNSDHKLKTESIINEVKDLYNFHQKTVRDFQHERTIHLTVTLFFVGLLLLSIATMFLFALAPATYNFTLMSALILIVVIILFITDIFYIRHYYQLENGTQRLYDLSKSLYDLTHKH